MEKIDIVINMLTSKVSLIPHGTQGKMDKVLLSHTVIEHALPQGIHHEESVVGFHKLFETFLISLEHFDIDINKAAPIPSSFPGNSAAIHFLLQSVDEAIDDAGAKNCMMAGSYYFMYEIWLADILDLQKIRNFGKRRAEKIKTLFEQSFLSLELKGYLTNKLRLIEGRQCSEYSVLTSSENFKTLALMLKNQADIKTWPLSHFASVVDSTSNDENFYKKMGHLILEKKQSAVDHLRWSIETLIKKSIYFEEVRNNILIEK